MTYTLITVASAAPAAHAEMVDAVGALAAELRAEAAPVTIRYGTVMTGANTGDGLFYQVYRDLAGIEKATAHYAKSSAYARFSGIDGFTVKTRNIVRNEDVGLADPSTDAPPYAVMTRWACDDLLLDELREVLPVWEANGATVARYGTLMTGSDTGKRLLTVGFSSMDAIERTYDALAGNATFRTALEKLEMDWRNIVRVHG